VVIPDVIKPRLCSIHLLHNLGLTGGLSVPRKSGYTRNADLISMQHGGPDLSGFTGCACALLIGHETKKDIPMLNHIVSLIYNPEAKHRGHLRGIKSDFIVDIKELEDKLKKEG